MKKLYLVGLICLLGGIFLPAQNIISNADLEAGVNYFWTNDQEYILNGVVYVKPGSNLTIEAGTVIYATVQPTTDDFTSMLVVSAGATIQALGQPNCPIIFTTELDDISNPNDLTQEDRGFWGGVAILGNGILGTQSPNIPFEGLPVDEPNAMFGGDDNAESSGVFEYVSIRHAGGELTPGDESNCLTLAGVGSGTTVNHIEAYAGSDDGIEIWGGAVNPYYLVSLFCADDAFDVDLGWVGHGQYWYGIGGDNGLELDGAQPDDNPVFSNPTLSHMTLIGGAQDRGDGVLIRDGAAASIHNSIFSSFTDFGLSLEENGLPSSTYQKFLNGEITFTNSLWFDMVAGNDPADFLAVLIDNEPSATETADLVAHFNANNNVVTDPLLATLCIDDISCLDPTLQAGSPANTGALALGDPFIEDVPFRGAFDNFNWMTGWSVVYPSTGAGDCENLNFVDAKLTLQIDANNNCLPDEGEEGLANWVILIESPSFDYYVRTDENGEYNGIVPENATNAILLAQNYTWFICENNLPLEGLGESEVVNAAFTASPIYDCPFMTVDVSTPLLRRCFENRYRVQYCNDGTVTAEDATVEVLLDEFFDFNSASLPFTINGDGEYVFEVGDVPPGTCGNIDIEYTLSCEAELGQSHCIQAQVFPDTICILPESRAELESSATCDGEEVLFQLTNISEVNMTTPINYIVIEDHVMMQSPTPDILLAAGVTKEIRLPANGSTYHLQTLRYPDFPDLGDAVSGIEGCGVNEMGDFSTGFLTGFNLDPGKDSEVLECRENIGAYDPNDKAALPQGLQEEHYLKANTDIEYKIRFQNTGTDTAFTIVVVDTLDQNLDISRLQPGVASHDYTWSLEGRTLTFAFENIMLPDSNINEPASHGFVKFKIAQELDLPDGILLKNFVDIYFDFNEPIRTNEVFHTIGQPPINIINDVEENGKELIYLQTIPNPFSEETQIQLGEAFLERGMLQVFDQQGKQVYAQSFTGNQLLLQRGVLPQGIYFFRLLDNEQLRGTGKFIIK